MEKENNDNKIKNMINNKCIENHIADMLENVLHDENKSEIDISLISEIHLEDTINNQKLKKNFLINEDLEYYPKNIKNNLMRSNTLKESFQKPEIFVNAPDTQDEFMNRKPPKDLLLNPIHNHKLNHNQNNLNTFPNNKNLMMNTNNLNFPTQMMPGINNLSPINNNFHLRDEEFTIPKKMQNNRLHINYVGPQNQNMFYNNNSNRSISPREMENNNNNNNNPSPRQYSASYNDNNNFSTSINR